MQKAKLMLFTSPTCPHCHSARRITGELASERKDFDYVEHSTASPQGGRIAKHFNIMSVPTTIIQGPGYLEPIGLVGTQTKQVLHKYLDVSLGLRDIDERTGLMDRFREGIKLGKLRLKI